LETAYPRGPILDWNSFRVVDAAGIGSVEDLEHVAFTTSGRAAIHHALLQLRLLPGSLVLVPTYHCPTMVAPVILAGLKVGYFGLTPEGLPDLASIDPTMAAAAKVILVSHYFGLARSLANVRQWCDERGIALIEDCAHCYFGNAGERPIGAWGDYCTASLAKFMPFSEGGLLASAKHEIDDLGMKSQGLKAQLKGAVDVLEMASRYQRLAGLNVFINAVLKLRRTSQRATVEDSTPHLVTEESMMRDCDMDRIKLAPLWTTLLLRSVLPRGGIIVQRQRNFSRYAEHFRHIDGARQLVATGDPGWDSAAPYVFPLWVEDADRVYEATRKLRLPIFRWDRIWPGTPLREGDAGPQWSRHVLQLLCHQNLDDNDIDNISLTMRDLITSKATSPAVSQHRSN
jgi:perosamine synthetase